MKVTIADAIDTPMMSVPAGTHDIDDDLAKELIAEGYAVKADDPKPKGKSKK